jgi:diaminopimelate decarboxylase
MQPLIDMSRADLAQRLGIPVDEIQGGGGFPVEWPDASLGHPQPGQVYAQVITQGYEITLEAGGKTYTYHTSMDAVVLVE